MHGVMNINEFNILQGNNFDETVEVMLDVVAAAVAVSAAVLTQTPAAVAWPRSAAVVSPRTAAAAAVAA